MEKQRRISQREARRLKRRVAALERAEDLRRVSWSQDYPGGTELTRCTWDNAKAEVPLLIRTARKLGHAVIAIAENSSGCVRFIALPHPTIER